MRRIPARFFALAVVSAGLQILSFPIAGPMPLWRTAFAWISLVPLLHALLGRDKDGRSISLLQGGLVAYLCGFVWYAGNCYWIYQTMNLYGGLPGPVALGILFLFALYLGLYHAFYGVLIAALGRSRLSRNAVLLLAPCVWVSVELARARITGFPWDLLGYTQIDNAVLTRLAPITGAYGLSFIVALVNSLWLARLSVSSRRYTRTALTAGGVLFFLGYLFALHALGSVEQNPATATANLVQENLSVGAERTGPSETTQQLLDSFTYLSTHPSRAFLSGIPELPSTPEVVTLHKGRPSELAEGEDQAQTWTPPVDLIVWPEAPSDFYTSDPYFLSKMHQLANSSGALLIVGSQGIDPNPDVSAGRPYFRYGSAAFFRPNDPGLVRYDKIHLVPWGEYVPFKSFFAFAKKLTVGVGDTNRGNSRTIYRQAGHTYAAFICYESIFGDEIRQFVRGGAEVLINISDDGWYGDTGAAWQHLNMVRMRAIENHRWILRSTNTGVTAAIDPAGRVTAAAPRHVRTSLHVGFGYEKDQTFYTQHGDLFAYACAMVVAVVLAWSATRHRSELRVNSIIL